MSEMFTIRTTVKGNLTDHPYFEKNNEVKDEQGNVVKAATETSLRADIPVNDEVIFSGLTPAAINRLALAQLRIQMRAPGAPLVVDGKPVEEIAKAIIAEDYNTTGTRGMAEEEKEVRKHLKKKYVDDENGYNEAIVRCQKAGWKVIYEKLLAVKI